MVMERYPRSDILLAWMIRYGYLYSSVQLRTLFIKWITYGFLWLICVRGKFKDQGKSSWIYTIFMKIQDSCYTSFLKTTQSLDSYGSTDLCDLNWLDKACLVKQSCPLYDSNCWWSICLINASYLFASNIKVRCKMQFCDSSKGEVDHWLKKSLGGLCSNSAFNICTHHHSNICASFSN